VFYTYLNAATARTVIDERLQQAARTRLARQALGTHKATRTACNALARRHALIPRRRTAHPADSHGHRSRPRGPGDPAGTASARDQSPTSTGKTPP